MLITKRNVFNFVLICSWIASFDLTLSAQTGQGLVEGRISDPSGASIAGADVTLTNEGTNVSQFQATDSNGRFRFPLVPPGTYSLSAKAKAFTEKQVKGIIVDASQTVPVNVNLDISGLSTRVEVTTREDLVQVASSDLATSINRRTIEDTPLLSRDAYDLVFVAPSVSPGINGNPTAGGVRESGTGFLLNGADNNDNFNEGAYNVAPPVESIGEVTIITNSMSAEYGRSGGAVVSAAQKSGTNRFHGVLYEFNRNRALEANDFFDNRTGAPKPQFNRNQFGGEVDGPIIKDRTFFSFAYDQIVLHTASPNLSAVQVFTPSVLATLQATAGPLAQKVLSAYPQKTSSAPCPNEPAAALGSIGCISVIDPQIDPVRSYFGRIDHNFNKKNRLSGTVNVTREDFTDALGGGYATSTVNIPLDNHEHYHNIALVDTHVFKPTLVNEFTLAHNRHYSKIQEGNGNTEIPLMIIDGLSYGNFGVGIGANEGNLVHGFTQDRWEVQDNVSIIAGSHNIRFGGNYQYGILYRNWDAGTPGNYEFANVFGSSPAGCGCLNPDGSVSNVPVGASNFQNDFPYYLETSIDPRTGAKADPYFHYAYTDGSLFINDEWKAARRLTVNLGLRWERFGAPHEVNGRLSNFPAGTDLNTSQGVAAAQLVPVSSLWHTNNHDFAPRVGFAYDLFGDGKTAIRGSYGIYYDRLFDYVWSNVASNPPFYAITDLNAIGPGSDSVYYSIPPSLGQTYVPNSIPSPSHRVGIKVVDPFLKDSSTQAFFLGAERQFAKDFLFRVSYQGTLGRHLPVLVNPNRFDGLTYNPTLHLSRPNPDYNIGLRENMLNSSYHSLVTEAQKRFSQGLQFQFSYVFSKLIDYGSDFYTGDAIRGGLSQPYYFISNAHLNLEKGAGAFDHTHSFKLNFVYELPFAKNQKGFLGQAFGGWQISSFFQGYSGHPLDVYLSRTRYAGNAFDANGNPENIGGDYNLDGVGQDRPNFMGHGIGSLYSHNNPADGIFVDTNPIGCGYAGAQSSNIAQCNSDNGVTTPNKFFIGPPGTGVKFGTLGRNVFRGPWFVGLNTSVAKSFKLTEALQLQIRVDAFNVLNHPNFDNINTDLAGSCFGCATTLVHDGSTSLADPGSISRRFQLGARLTF
jgi:Carboxypeptidase regulatory-like domain